MIDILKKRLLFEITQEYEDYEGNLLLVGINYDKKNKKHTCIIEPISK